MKRRPPRSTRTDTLFPYTTLFRSHVFRNVGIAVFGLADSMKITVSPGAMLAMPFSATAPAKDRSEEHTSELQSLMRISYAVFCLKKKKIMTKKYTQLYNTIY